MKAIRCYRPYIADSHDSRGVDADGGVRQIVVEGLTFVSEEGLENSFTCSNENLLMIAMFVASMSTSLMRNGVSVVGFPQPAMVPEDGGGGGVFDRSMMSMEAVST